MSHKLLYAVSVLPALLIMPAVATEVEEPSSLPDFVTQTEEGLKYINLDKTKLPAQDEPYEFSWNPEKIDLDGGTGASGILAKGVSLTLGDNNTTGITIEGKRNYYGVVEVGVEGNLTLGGNATDVEILATGGGKGAAVSGATLNINGKNIKITAEGGNAVDITKNGTAYIGNENTEKVTFQSTTKNGLNLGAASAKAIVTAGTINITSDTATAVNLITANGVAGASLELKGADKINITGVHTGEDKYAMVVANKNTKVATKADITGGALNVTGGISVGKLGTLNADMKDDITIKSDGVYTTGVVDMTSENGNIFINSGANAVNAYNTVKLTAKNGKINVNSVAADASGKGGVGIQAAPGSEVTVSAKDIVVNSDGIAVVSAATKDVRGNSAVTLNADTISLTSNNSHGLRALGLADVASSAKDKAYRNTIDINGNDISITSKGQKVDDEDVKYALSADHGGYITITGHQVDDKKSVVNIVSENASALLSQNATSGDYDGPISTVKIDADEINISGKDSGIVAMSMGVVDLTGDTTINAKYAIAARGDAQITINKSGEHTTNMTGDIDFGYHAASSGTPVDAIVDVTLAGADSKWVGNTIVSYIGKPVNDSKLIVNNATVNMKDGAQWVATKITDDKGDTNGVFYTALNNLNIVNGGTVNILDKRTGIAIDTATIEKGNFTGGRVKINKSATIKDSVFANHSSVEQGGAIYNVKGATITMSGTNMFSGNRAGDIANDIYNDGVVTISDGDTTVSGGILGSGDFTLNNGATLNLGTATILQNTITLNGTVNADIVSAQKYGKFDGDMTFGENALLNLNVATAGTYKIFSRDTSDKLSSDNINVGTLFSVENTADGVVISAKPTEDLAAETGLSAPAAATLVGLANAGGPLAAASIAAQKALDAGAVDVIEAEVAKVAPAEKPITHSVSTSVQNQVLSLVASRMAGAGAGRSGGDFVTTGAGMWAHGLINRSKMNGAFHGDTRGMAVGVDATFNRKYTFGMGYAYGDTDISAGANKTDIESNTLFAYAQYKPGNWFVNGAFNYTFADYSTGADLFGVNITNEYDVDSYGAQLMTGYDFATGVTPMAGVRYLHISQDDYNNGIADIKSDDSDFVTGVAGLKYVFDINLDRGLVLRPELRAAATYDFVSDESVATVLMPGAASYIVNADRLSRFGSEFGIGISALIDGIELSVNYDLDLHEDYTSQTGMLKFRYNF